MNAEVGSVIPIDAGILGGGLCRDFTDSTILSDQAHGMGQIKLALSGMMVVSSSDGHWVVPPNRALWLAPYVTHKTRMLGKVQLRSVFINPGFLRGLPAKSGTVPVSPLFREIVCAVAAAPSRDGSSRRIELLMALLVEEVARHADLPLHLPTPHDHRLATICTHIQEHLDDTKTLQEWAKDLGYDQRTLHRLFVQELGMPFMQWRQQAKLLTAMEWLAEGRQVLGIALDLGYQTQSAFTAMFRRNLGMTPSDFMKTLSTPEA